MSDNKFLLKLSQNLLEVLEDDEYYDITIEVVILRYIYGGSLSLEQYETSDIIKILITANELNLQELVEHLQTFLIENNAEWMETNFNLIYQTSFENSSFLELQKYCTDSISKEPSKIFKSSNYSSISKNILISLIQSDNLRMSEVQIWKNILKWGHAQNPELPSDPASLSKEDFNVLKGTLQHFIPFIRFYNLTGKEISDTVLPYREILPEELFVDLFSTFLDIHPNSVSINKSKPRKLINVDSNIITFKHAELISKWIDKLSTTDEFTPSYEFKLILRGSRDGFAPNKFHEICDGKSRTVSIIKVRDSDEILGGYNPIEWKQDERVYDVTNESFIFSFETADNIEKHILSRVENEQNAIFNVRDCGPLFGEYGEDLAIWGDDFYNKSYCIKRSYEKQIRKFQYYFSVEEYEVFQIIKESDF
ncbi:carbohydrate-binding module family 13 protein [Rhizophagus clarus]|uniref:Carbohydrate-binding module family 13 protein n=1 Tax=Rhizophagus clarus TaxID=94130 RepID=A0A8H3QY23_9GLOM|nr:carbohydrate-binding module family 13 protein [Rhizophagus clarus]